MPDIAGQILLSVVVPTKNESSNIVRCLRSFDAAVSSGECEVIVVDNHSCDDTARLARECGAKVVEQGPERSAQRNRGAYESSGKYLLFMDADMSMPGETLDEILSLVRTGLAPDGLYIPEVRTGNGFRSNVRNFERSFYNGTDIDALRVMRKSVFEQCGGYDVNLTGPEDWDLDLRFLKITDFVRTTSGCLYHHEKELSLRELLRKKSYYSDGLKKYRRKWPNEAAVKRQFSFFYRFAGVFLEDGKWRRVLRHPFLFLFMLMERMCVGCVFLLCSSRVSA